MLYRLESVLAVVAHHSVAVFKTQIGGDVLDFKHEMCDELAVFLGKRVDTLDVLLRNDKNVNRCLRFQVVEADYLTILLSYV